MYLTVQALVLRVAAYNDYDALLTLLTRDRGKITVKARGLRRKNNPMTAACQVLAFSEFMLFEYRGNYTVNEVRSIQLFHKLRNDLQKLSLGSYFSQIAELICQEDVPNPELQSLLLNSLHALAELDTPEPQVKAVFELRSACLAGYTPDLSCCHNCGKQDADLFDISEGVLECSGCRVPSSGIRMPISAGVLDGMRYICLCDAKRLFSFHLPVETMLYLSQVTESYLAAQLERGFSALDFYKSLLTLESNFT
jgi:DNA repair protein RecO (recombination protein O)